LALWFGEAASPYHRLEWKIRRELFFGQSPYQTIQVLDTEQFGPSLVLDGIMQTTRGDEFIYHEMLAHVPLCAHPRPERVLIIGGGDGGLAREVLKHQRVRTVVLVEIDPLVVEVSRRYLPEHTVALDDPRLQLIHQDGAQFLQQTNQKWDVILVDSTDPEGTGPGRVLYTPAFHEAIFHALADDGLYVQQTGTPFYNPEVVSSVSQDVAAKFPLCRVYWCAVPTYPGAWFTFTAGSKQYDLQHPQTQPSWPTRWYTPKMHRLAFALPPFVHDLLPDLVVQGQES
jgi:spermidine synthase